MLFNKQEDILEHIVALMHSVTTPILVILIYLYKKIAHLMQIFLIKTSYL